MAPEYRFLYNGYSLLRPERINNAVAFNTSVIFQIRNSQLLHFPPFMQNGGSYLISLTF